MMVLDDVLEIAWSIEEKAKAVMDAKSYDIRKRMVVTLEATPVEIRSIDCDLWRMTHGDDFEGHKKCDHIDASICGTRFIIVPKQKQTEEVSG